ncbi:MAG: hypothetical protein ACD_79C00212G0002 [uncultured bacterium]|nr:MAG: hypothetical protein ACD_79C00212G0002 [uncultured bacterium]
MDKVWRIIDLLNWGTEYFGGKGIEQPRLNIEFLLTHVLHKTRMNLYVSYEEIVEEKDLKVLKEFIHRRVNNEPLMYILGETEFYDCKIKVDKRVLIPRPETESMVDEAVSAIKKFSLNKIADLGTGSGCIAIALAHKFKELAIDAVDNSSDAIALARENALLNGVSERINFIKEYMHTFLDNNKGFDLIISNPPYISLPEYENLSMSVKKFEPMAALTDGDDGKKIISGIIQRLPNVLAEKGIAFIEFGYLMGDWILQYTKDCGLTGKIFEDIHKLPRFIRVKKNN